MRITAFSAFHILKGIKTESYLLPAFVEKAPLTGDEPSDSLSFKSSQEGLRNIRMPQVVPSTRQKGERSGLN